MESKYLYYINSSFDFPSVYECIVSTLSDFLNAIKPRGLNALAMFIGQTGVVGSVFGYLWYGVMVFYRPRLRGSYHFRIDNDNDNDNENNFIVMKLHFHSLYKSNSIPNKDYFSLAKKT